MQKKSPSILYRRLVLHRITKTTKNRHKNRKRQHYEESSDFHSLAKMLQLLTSKSIAHYYNNNSIFKQPAKEMKRSLRAYLKKSDNLNKKRISINI